MKLMQSGLKDQEDLNNKICFMDMRAEAELSPKDAETIKFVVFGGILGDHPPQDRAKDFREDNFK